MADVVNRPEKFGPIDPLALIEEVWPDVRLYDKQKEIVQSVWNNDETITPAGNMLGKDYISALIAIMFYLTRKPAIVVTSSVDQGQLEKVLWGEIHNFIQSAKYALPFHVKHCEIRRIYEGATVLGKDYLIGRVASRENQGTSLLGHHLARGPNNQPRTLALIDEASGFNDDFKTKMDTWSHRTLIIGNPYPCDNFFYRGVTDGPVPSEDGSRMYRNIIKIKAEDSPNVKFALWQKSQGLAITDEIVVPGVLGYSEYVKRRTLWDAIKQCISLDAEFYKGKDVLLYPPTWLDRAERRAEELRGKQRKLRTVMGVDSARGGDYTAWAIGDELGLLYLLGLKTPDTSVIPKQTLALMRQYNVAPGDILFDSGGGGAEHADRLRDQGYKVRTVAFGEAASPPTIVRRVKSIAERTEEKEQQYIYKNRRAEMYGLLRRLLSSDEGWGLPREYAELRRQLAPIPLWYDEEGRLYLPPKDKRSDQRSIAGQKLTLKELIGRSPDEADATVLVAFGLFFKAARARVGAINI